MPPPDFNQLQTLSQQLVDLGNDFHRVVKTLRRDTWEPFAIDRARTHLQQFLDCGSEIDDLLQASLRGETL